MDPSEPTTTEDEVEDNVSVTARARRWCSKHKKTIKSVGIGVIAVAATGLVLLLAKDYDVIGDDATGEPVTPDMRPSEPEAQHAASGQEDEEDQDAPSERTTSAHHVSGHLMKTNGQPSEAAKAAYDEAYRAGLFEDPEIPEGYTYRQDHERNSNDEDEGEAED